MDKDREIDLPYQRGPILESINAILSYQRMNEMLDSIDKQINELAAKDAVHNINNFKNPRQEQKYLHDVYTLTVLKRRQERLKQKLAELQDRIQSDIETDKRYINTQRTHTRKGHKMIDYAKKSLEGLWVGDCIGNLGQIYHVGDILKALEQGMVKFGGQLSKFHKQFQYSDDTEEGIVLYHHIQGKTAFSKPPLINQDKLAMEFATRYMVNDPDGEIYGYGLNTRKVLKDIYEGTPWNEANKFMKPKAEGMPSHIDSLVNSLSTGKDMKAAMHEVNLVLERQKKGETGGELQGSCGNGSAMRVAPLGAYLASQLADKSGEPDKNGLLPFEKHIIAEAVLQSEPTHCHPEGIAGAIAITSLTYDVTTMVALGEEFNRNTVYDNLIRRVPEGIVRQGILKAQIMPYETPIGKAIEILGNGTHVICQDTVPLCCWLAIKHLDLTGKDPETYEKAIIETSMAFGDVDTNCAIVGGIVGVVCPPPAKWTQFCEPMEGVL